MVFGYTRLPETAAAVRPQQDISAESSGFLETFGNTEVRTLASISSLSVNNSSHVSVGDTFVRQTLYNEEVVKARFLCLQFESAVSMRRFRCSLAVFLCWSLTAAASIAFYILIFVWPYHQPRLDIDLWEPWYLRREDWKPMRAFAPEFLSLPVNYVLISHTGDEYCNDNSTCAQTVKELQNLHLKKGLFDIGANYLVGGNGWVFEGTGGNVRSSWLSGMESISILFIGNYVKDSPDIMQFDHISIVLDMLVLKGVLHSNYQIYGECQIESSYSSPGRNIIKKLNVFLNWSSSNVNLCT